MKYHPILTGLHRIRRGLTCCLLLSAAVATAQTQINRANKIWFEQPADALAVDSKNGWESDPEWLKALPIGNGSLGAMVFGDVNRERIQLNEMTLWSGSFDEGDNPAASQSLPKIRELLFQGKYREATELTNKTQITKGKGSGSGNGANVPFGCFQTLGDLRLNFGTNAPYQDYHRELDLINGIAKSSFVQNGVRFTREIFASHPDQAILIRLTADKAAAINVLFNLDRPERFATEITALHGLRMFGVLDNGRGGDGMRYEAQVTPILEGGRISSQTKAGVQIEGANAVTLIVTAKTNYKQHYPDYVNANYQKEHLGIIKSVMAKSYATLKDRHSQDFSSFMKRVSFQLGNDIPNLPTNELMANNFRSGNEQALYPLYFQYGRYLLLSSSRSGGLPANLQGIWANKIQTPWNGDYHTDINVQMNYWPAEVANLSESHRPLMDLIASLVAPGGKTAQIQYGMQGWALHPITNVWGYTSPGESASWGMHIGAGAWIAQHIWEHYAFMQDKEFLRWAYPILKGASAFYLDWLTVDPKSGLLVSGPSPSPENSFKAPDGSTAQISMGPSHDQQVIYNLFDHTLRSAAILGLREDEFLNRLQESKAKLARPKIGRDGRLMEWAEEFEEVEPAHRHLSHLFALYPGNEITVSRTPELAKAAQLSLEKRGDDGVGWTYAWKIALWARLHQGNRALKLLNKQLRPTADMDTKYDGGGGTYYNLFDACPPFQIDGNFGVIAGMAEMLLQSHEDFIELLPALPDSWKAGEIKGLMARGAIEIDLKWAEGKLLSAGAKAKKHQKCQIKYAGRLLDIELPAGKRVEIKI
ncbi:MAG: glycoside hydrolase family 95 protein [Sphingobacterium sp.]|jgi:alpha-L-fucosidase 2|nr:glycoside hydrolase family 95 protein [Sphingobacterium sp.]